MLQRWVQCGSAMTSVKRDAFSTKTTRQGAKTLKHIEHPRLARATASREVRRREAAGRCGLPGHRQRDRRQSREAESYHRQSFAGRWCRESRPSTEEDSLSVWVLLERDHVDRIADPNKRVAVLSREIGDRTSNRGRASCDPPSSDHRGLPDNRHKLPKPDGNRRRKKRPNTGTANCL